MKNTLTNSFKAALWSIALVFGMMACTQMEQDTINEMSFPDKVAFVKSNGLNGMNFRTAGEICGSEDYCMLAGQKELAGAGYTVSNDEDNVYFTIATSGDWYITEAQLTYGADYKTMPGVGRNNVAPGQFILKSGLNPAVQEFTFTVAIADLPEAGTFYFAFHGVVVRIDGQGNVLQGETAYTCGPRIHAKGVWARYASYTIAECDTVVEEDDCYAEQTAYGGASAGAGSAWWYYFDTKGDSEQMIYAGQNPTDAKVIYDSEKDIITIDLGSLKLQIDSEAVKVLGYDVVPSERPASGGGPNSTRFYAGTELVINGNGSNYYVIHLDAFVPTTCPVIQ